MVRRLTAETIRLAPVYAAAYPAREIQYFGDPFEPGPFACAMGRADAVREMDDAAAYLGLLTNNAKGELTALERGMHPLRSGM